MSDFYMWLAISATFFVYMIFNIVCMVRKYRKLMAELDELQAECANLAEQAAELAERLMSP